MCTFFTAKIITPNIVSYLNFVSRIKQNQIFSSYEQSHNN